MGGISFPLAPAPSLNGSSSDFFNGSGLFFLTARCFEIVSFSPLYLLTLLYLFHLSPFCFSPFFLISVLSFAPYLKHLSLDLGFLFPQKFCGGKRLPELVVPTSSSLFLFAAVTLDIPIALWVSRSPSDLLSPWVCGARI